MPDAYPRLRDEIDAAPADRDGETYYILYDRSGVSGTRLLVSPMGLLIAGRMDGGASILDIADALGREYGGTVACGEVEQVAAALNDALFLEGPRFQDVLEQIARDFRAGTVRPAGSAGSAYDDDPVRLAADLERMMAEAPPCEEPGPATDNFPKGVIVPHIDFLRGSAGYGQAYGLLRQKHRPKTVVVIGTAHTPMRERYCLCEKDFETPLGTLAVDRDMCRELRRALSAHADLDHDLLTHRGEHSIELQAVWLRHLYGDDVTIVPLLAGSLGEFLDGDGMPRDAWRDPVVRGLAGFLGDAVSKGDVMVVASADLAHIGPRFGDNREITNQYLAEVEESDRKYLASLDIDAMAGLESLAEHGDSHHVCGSACIFAVGKALPAVRTRLLGYHQAVTPEMRQAVSFAAMTLG